MRKHLPGKAWGHQYVYQHQNIMAEGLPTIERDTFRPCKPGALNPCVNYVCDARLRYDVLQLSARAPKRPARHPVQQYRNAAIYTTEGIGCQKWPWQSLETSTCANVSEHHSRRSRHCKPEALNPYVYYVCCARLRCEAS